MNCLDETQIEDALAGQAGEQVAEHLASCPPCRARLAAAQADRDRLRQAFARAHLSAASLAGIRQATVGGGNLSGSATAPGRHAAGNWFGRSWPRLAIAASLMFAVAGGMWFFLNQPGPAQAAAAELVKLHQQNLSGLMHPAGHQSTTQGEEYLASHLGFAVAIPRDQGELRMRGCCMARFLGHEAGSYIVDGPEGPTSVIVSDANSRQLMTNRQITRGGRTYWVCQMEGYYTVAVQVDRLVYCAVGSQSPDKLVAILDSLLRGKGD